MSVPKITQAQIDYYIEQRADKKWAYEIHVKATGRQLAEGHGFRDQEEVCAYTERLIATYPVK